MNWSLFCKINLICSIILIADWAIGISSGDAVLKHSFLTSIYPDAYLRNAVPLISFIVILSITPLLNKEINGSPFFLAVFITIVLYLGGSQYTALGIAAQFSLKLTCSIIISIILFMIVLLRIEQPVSPLQLLTGAFFILLADILIRYFSGSGGTGPWAPAYLTVILSGIFIIKRRHLFTGAAIIFIIALLNNYLIKTPVTGFDTGANILKTSALLIALRTFPLKNIR